MHFNKAAIFYLNLMTIFQVPISILESKERELGRDRGKERERRGKVDVLGSRDERSHVLRETGQQAEINRGQDTDNQQD